MIRVRFLTSSRVALRGLSPRRYGAGECVNVPDDTAETLIRSGAAKLASAPPGSGDGDDSRNRMVPDGYRTGALIE